MSGRSSLFAWGAAAWVLLAAMPASASLSSFTVGTAADGVQPLDASLSAPANPGYDASRTNGFVRTRDSVEYDVTLTTGFTAETNVRFTAELPDDIDGTPIATWSAPQAAALCTGTGGGTVSNGGRTLTCNVGSLGASSIRTFPLFAVVGFDRRNGTVLRLPASAFSISGSSTPARGPFDPQGGASAPTDVTVTAAPLYDVNGSSGVTGLTATYGNFGPQGQEGWRIVARSVLDRSRRFGQEVLADPAVMRMSFALPSVVPAGALVAAPWLNGSFTCDGSGGSSCTLGNFTNSVAGRASYTLTIPSLDHLGSSTRLFDRYAYFFLPRSSVPTMVVGTGYTVTHTAAVGSTSVSGQSNNDPVPGNESASVTLRLQVAGTVGKNFTGASNGQIAPGQRINGDVALANTGTETWSSGYACDKVDNTRFTLAGNASLIDSNLGGSTVTIEYGVGGVGGIGGSWSSIANVASAGRPAVGGSTHGTATCDDGESPAWYPNTAAVIAAGRSLQDVTKVRFRVTNFGPARSFSGRVPLTARSTFAFDTTDTVLGPVAAGQPIPDLSFLPNQAVLSRVVGAGAPVYTRQSDAVRFRGRLTDSRVSKSATPGAGSTVANGSVITYRLVPNQTTTVSPSPGTLTVVDVLPPELSLVAGSPNIAPSSIESDVPAAGFTRMTWIIPNVTPFQGGGGASGGNQPAITYQARSSLSIPNRTALLNSVSISGGASDSVGDCGYSVATRQFTGCGDTKRATTSHTSASVIGFQLDKVPARPQFSSNGPLAWSVSWAQVGGSSPPGIEIIDVLPFAGDGVADLLKARDARDPATALSGTLTLAGVDVPANDPSLVVRFTSTPPTQIHCNPYDASNNLTSGSTRWCLMGELGTAGCPADLAAATAVRLTPGNLAPNTNYTATVRMNGTGNLVGERTGNMVQASATTFNGAFVASPSAVAEVAPAALSGVVFDDRDGDSVQDPTEPGIADVLVRMTRAGGGQELFLRTAANGTFAFAFGALVWPADPSLGGAPLAAWQGIDEGSWTVTRLTLPATGFAGTPTAGTLGGTVSGLDSVTAIDIAPGATGNDYAFPVLRQPTAPAITSPADQAAVASARPPISGISDPGTVVVVADASGELCNGLTAADGNWSCTPTRDLPEGLTTLTPTATTGALLSTVGAPSGVFVDTVAPDTSIAAGPASPVAQTSAAFELGSSDAAPSSGVTAYRCSLDLTSFVPCQLDGQGRAVVGPLADGPHTLDVSAVDRAGNVDATPAHWDWVVDATAPLAPVIASPLDQAQLPASPTAVSGTAEAASTVLVTLDGSPLCTTTADAQTGAWSCPISTTLADGTHQATAAARDLSGNLSPTAVSSFGVDTVIPTVTITSPVTGTTLGSAPAQISGSAEPGALVTVTLDGNALCTATADVQTGSWSCAVSGVLADGSHTAHAEVADRAGNTGTPADSTFRIDSTAPSAPVITTPADQTVTRVSSPLFEGTAEAGTTLTVLSGTDVICTATVDAAGAWSCTATVSLADGSYAFIARSQDSFGRDSAVSATVRVLIDTVAPLAPVVLAPLEAASLATATPTFSGTAEALSLLTVREGTTTLCTATVDATGAWSCTPTAPLTEGLHAALASASDAAGNVSPDATPRTFTVDLTAPLAPQIDQPAEGALLALATPRFSGTSEVGVTVTVTEAGTALCTATVDAQGLWQCTPTAPLAEGDHVVTAAAVDLAGNAGPASGPRAFEIDTVAPLAPVIANPSSGSATNDPTPTVSGTAEAGSHVRVTEGTTLICEADADATGAFACTPTTALRDGLHTFVATATDPAGNVSPDSDPVTFTLDTRLPASPVIARPLSAARVSDRRPMVSGTAPASSTVDVRMDGATFCTVAAAATGEWFCFAPLALDEGPHVVTATATSAVGNVSSPARAPFVIDVTAPAQPTLDAPADGSRIANPTPTLSITTEPSALVVVRLDGAATPLCSTRADQNGLVSCRVIDPLAEGTHLIQLLATDAAGNATSGRDAVLFIDRTAPLAPTLSAPADGAALVTRRPQLAGHALPGARVEAQLDGAAACSATADEVTGAWSCSPEADVELGRRALSLSAVDAAGNRSPVSTAAFDLLAAGSSSPTVAMPAHGTTTADATPVASGSATPGARIELRLDDAALCSTTADSVGSWSCPVGTELTAGTHTLSATASEANQDAAAPSVSRFVVDLVAPAVPRITAPAAGARLADAQVVLSGTAGPHERLLVQLDGVERCRTVADVDGRWACPATTRLGAGLHVARAVARGAGELESSSESSPFTVDLVAPAAPAFTAQLDGSVAAARRPVFGGLSEVGSTVVVQLNGVEICRAPATATGAFTCSPAADLAPGGHLVTALAIDAAGNVGPLATLHLGISATEFATPSITSPAPGSHGTERRPVFLGTATAGSRVTLTLDGAPLCVATADARGGFTCLIANPLAEGEHQLAVGALPLQGRGSRTVISRFTVDAVAPGAPLFTRAVEGDPLFIDAGPVDAGLQDGGFVDGGTSDAGSLDAGSADAGLFDGGSTDGGSADAGSVDAGLFDGGSADGGSADAGLADADAGSSSDAGSSDAGGADAGSTDAGRVDGGSPDAGEVDGGVPFIEGNLLLADHASFGGVGEPGATVEVSVDGLTVCSAPVDATGRWSCIPAEAVVAGEHALTATQLDAAGNRSGATALRLTADLSSPLLPGLGTPLDGSTSLLDLPLFSGAAEPGALVLVRDAERGQALCAAVVDSLGNWGCQPLLPLPEGGQRVAVVVRDLAGNRSPVREASFIVDAVEIAPTTSSSSSGSSTGGGGPQLGSVEGGGLFGCSSTGGFAGLAPALLAFGALRRRRASSRQG